MRPIDADALITAVIKKAIDDAFLNGNTDMHKLLIQVVAHQPTVDAVQVIRCRDCKHYAGDGMYCSWNMIARPDGYCFHANEGPVYSDY